MTAPAAHPPIALLIGNSQVLHDGGSDVLAAFAAYGNRGGGDLRGKCRGKRFGGFANVGAEKGESEPNAAVYSDTGTAARFFYSAKASKKDRGLGNDHPTVKPAALAQWMVRLVCPAGGTVLDPFLGSGTTAVACRREGRGCVGIEQSADYLRIAERRLAAESAPEPTEAA